MPPTTIPRRTLRTLRTFILHRPQCRQYTKNHSVDASEISHFTALAADWWAPNGSSRLLHLMNPLRLRFIRSCIPQSASELRYLDVGCGGGILAESLARLATTKSVLGIDPTHGVLEVAREHMRSDPALQLGGKLRYRECTVDAVGDEGEFNVVTAMEVVEHVPDVPRFLRQCMDRVAPGGWLVGSTIARSWMSYVTTVLVAEDLLGIVPKGTHDWRKYMNFDELAEFFAQQEGWGELRFMGCIYVPGLGWREVKGGEKVGNYFFGIRRLE